MFPPNSISFLFLFALQYFLHTGLTLEIGSREISVKSSLDWQCSSDLACTAKGSKCVDKRCQCSTGYIFNAGMTSCVKVASKLGDQCIEDIQCSRYLFAGGQCANNACICAKGFYYLNGKCNAHAELFASCKSDGDCYVHADFEAAFCDKGVCHCRSEYYQREYRTCRRSSKALGDDCLINADCHFDKDAYCNDDLVCAKNEAVNQPEKPSASSINAKTKNKNPSGIVVGGKCEKDDDCKALGKAECTSDGTCACQRANFPSKSKDQCVPELGEPCQSQDAVIIKNSVCRNGRWACKGVLVAAADRQKCKKASRRLGESCQSDEQCSVLGPDAYCESRKCACNNNSHYVEEEEFCWIKKAYGESCQRDLDCYVDGFKGSLDCLNNICSCPNGTRLHSSGLQCVTSSAGIGMVCDQDSDCITENAVCSDYICACADSYFEMDGHCLAGINATCATNDDCAVRNSQCVSEKCNCQEKYVASSVSSCLPVASHGESCTEDIQCSTAIANTECRSVKNEESESETTEKSADTESTDEKSDGKICSCKEQYYLKNGSCFKRRELGESCRVRDDCYLESNNDLAICLNGFCSCSWGYTSATSTSCEKARDIQPYNRSSVGSSTSIVLQSVCLILLLIKSSTS